MKAILVINIPDYIQTATKGIVKLIGAVGKLEIGYGSDDGEMIMFHFSDVDGALVKPLPQPRKIYNPLTPQEDKEVTFNQGYNKCLEDVGG